MFTDPSYPNGTFSIMCNFASHTSDGLGSFLNDLNIVDTASVGTGMQFDISVSATKTASARDGVINIQYTTNSDTTGTAYIIFEGNTNGATMS